MNNRLKKNKEYKKKYKVLEKYTTGHIGVNVLSTPSMVELVEKTSNEFIQNYFSDNKTTVGTKVNIKHINPIKENEEIVILIKLIEKDGPKLELCIKVINSKNKIVLGKGTHQRFIVDKEKFKRKLEEL